jgi:hypothetical protein
MAKYIALYVLARLLSVAALLAPPLRQHELRLLHRVYLEGPGGADDDVQMLLMRNRTRYEPVVQKMLLSSNPQDKEVALEFEELVSNSREPRSAL